MEAKIGAKLLSCKLLRVKLYCVRAEKCRKNNAKKEKVQGVGVTIKWRTTKWFRLYHHKIIRKL